MKDLENFAAASNCKTMGDAARKLGISQPALSESIQRLETDISALVFYRSRSGIQLTPKGRLFLERVKNLLVSVDRLEIENKEENVFGGQSISVGCHQTVASYTLPVALAEVQKVAPDFKIELYHDLSRNIQAEIQKGRLDIGIVINPVRNPDLIITRLSYDVVRVWGRKNQKEADTLILNSQFFQTQSILKKWKNRPQKTIDTDSLDLICRLTGKGIGYGIIPTKAVELSGLDLHPIQGLPIYKDEIALIYRPEFGGTRAERLIIDSLKAAFHLPPKVRTYV
ncbi:MAG TPA: LysR family transcriptional regulator [Bdellovibrio sp.]|nr:LysR family transcriptional regulator [Bdellovibrio sp.]